jgi:signal transduction histidine kinase
MFGISAIWVFNGGIDGSVFMPAFIILILGLLVAPEKTKKYIITLFIALNIFILLIQFYRPELIIEFPNETDRWRDYIITFIYSSCFIYLIIRFVHKNYTLERLKAEKSEIKLRKLNADKDRFIAILGHDLKNPFNSLLGLSEILIEDVHKVDIEEVEIIANHINTTAKNTYKLLEDILMWARAQQNSISFKPQLLNLKDICISTLEVLDPNAIAKNITIKYSAADEISIFADIDMLKTILRNFVSNAIKFTKKGGTININAEENSGEVRISVSDTGIGISDVDLAKLFDISQFISSKGTENEKGTGLGLLICKEFVEKHGGKIWADSTPGKGSSFHFTVPSNTELKDINVVG